MVPPPSPHAFANVVLGAGVLTLLDSPNCGAQCSSPSFLRYPLSNAAPLTILSYWSKGFECVAPCSCWEPACRRYQLPSPQRMSSRACRRYQLPSPQRKSSRSPSVFGYCVPWMWRAVEALQLYCLGWIYAGTYLRICESYSGPRETCFTA